MSSIAALLAIPGSTCPEGVARRVLNDFLYFLHSRFARKADNRVKYLRMLNQ